MPVAMQHLAHKCEAFANVTIVTTKMSDNITRQMLNMKCARMAIITIHPLHPFHECIFYAAAQFDPVCYLFEPFDISAAAELVSLPFHLPLCVHRRQFLLNNPPSSQCRKPSGATTMRAEDPTSLTMQLFRNPASVRILV